MIDVLSVVGLGVSAFLGAEQCGTHAYQCYNKGSAERSFHQAAEQLEQTKKAHQIVAKYLTEDERKDFDAQMERGYFDMMELRKRLEEIGQIKAWALFKLVPEVRDLKRSIAVFRVEISGIHNDLLERSQQVRTKSVVATTTEGSPEGVTSLNTILQERKSANILARGSNNNDRKSNHDVIDEIIDSVNANLSAENNADLSVPFPCIVNDCSKSGDISGSSTKFSSNVPKLAPVPGNSRGWHVESKSVSVPASLTSDSEIELRYLPSTQTL